MSVEKKKLEQLIAGIGHALGESLDGEFGRRTVGYAVMIFDFGDSGTLAYASNGQREDMIKVLAETLVHLRGS